MIMAKGDKVRFRDGIVTVTDIDLKLKVAKMLFFPSSSKTDEERPFTAPLSLEVLRLYCTDPTWIHPLNYLYGYDKFQLLEDERILYESYVLRMVTPPSFCNNGIFYLIKNRSTYPLLDPDLFRTTHYSSNTIKALYLKRFTKETLDDYLESLVGKPLRATLIKGTIVEISRNKTIYEAIDTAYSPYADQYVAYVKTGRALLIVPLNFLKPVTKE